MGVGMMQSKRRIQLNEPHLVTPALAGLHTFSTNMVAPLKECRINFSPVQEGTGDPSPDNVRSITGWTGISVNRNGKNFLPAQSDSSEKNGITFLVEKNENGYISRIHAEGTATSSTSFQTLTHDFYLPAGNYILKTLSDGSSSNHDFNLRKKGTTTDIVQRTAPKSFTVPELTAYSSAYIYVWNRVVCNFDAYPMIRLASETDDTFEPYNGQTISIDWTTEAGTVYGGYVDLVKGILVETQKIINLGSINWKKRNSGVFYSQALSDKGNANMGLICSHYPYRFVSTIDNTEDKTINDSYQVRLNCVNIYDSDYAESTEGEFRSAMNGVMCVYYLSTPVIHQLDPITIKTLRGINNIWSNANGDIELSYWTH